MYRTLISSPHIGSYSALLLIAFLLGWWLARRNAVSSGIPPRHVDNLTLIIVVASLFGARFFSWLFYLPPGYGFVKAMTMSGGGLVFYGGLIFAIITVFLYAVMARLQLRNILDVFAAPAALGLALGRVGCFMAGCCWGDVCIDPKTLASQEGHVRYQVQTVPALSPSGFPLAVTFPPSASAYSQHQGLKIIGPHAARSAPVHPVQLYEAALALILTLMLQRSFKRRPRAGDVAVQLVIGYSLIRFLTEFFRGDNLPLYWGLTISQVISVVLAGVCLGLVRLSMKESASLHPSIQGSAR